MIRAHFGLDQNPFVLEDIKLLPQQQEVFDTLRVHCQQGGLCLLVGERGATVSEQTAEQGNLQRLFCLTAASRHYWPVLRYQSLQHRNRSSCKTPDLRSFRDYLL